MNIFYIIIYLFKELNRRGETISSLKEVVSMYEKKVIDLNNQQDCSLSTIKQLRDELTDRTQRLHDLSNQQETNRYAWSVLAISKHMRT